MKLLSHLMISLCILSLAQVTHGATISQTTASATLLIESVSDSGVIIQYASGISELGTPILLGDGSLPVNVAGESSSVNVSDPIDMGDTISFGFDIAAQALTDGLAQNDAFSEALVTFHNTTGENAIISATIDYDLLAMSSIDGFTANANSASLLDIAYILNGNLEDVFTDMSESNLSQQLLPNVTSSYNIEFDMEPDDVAEIIFILSGNATSEAIPEPASMALLGLGGLLLNRRRKCQTR